MELLIVRRKEYTVQWLSLIHIFALGHPVGASGCRILVSLLHEMERTDIRYGLATLCVGGGMGVSTIIEKI